MENNILIIIKFKDIIIIKFEFFLSTYLSSKMQYYLPKYADKLYKFNTKKLDNKNKNIRNRYRLFNKKFVKYYVKLNKENINNVFVAACENGYLKAAKCLVKEYSDIDIHAEYDFAFRWSCEKGHLKIAKWLVEKYPDIDITDNINYVLYDVYSNGHLKIAKWLINYLRKKHSYICEYTFNEISFRLACASGHLKIAKWLVKKYPDIDIHAKSDYAFRYACINGHLKIAKWLVKKYPDINIHAENDFAFRSACVNGYISVVKWLVKKYPELRKLKI